MIVVIIIMTIIMINMIMMTITTFVFIILLLYYDYDYDYDYSNNCYIGYCHDTYANYSTNNNNKKCFSCKYIKYVVSRKKIYYTFLVSII